MGNSAPFANQSQRESSFNTKNRTLKNSLRLRQPESLNYESADITYKEPISFSIDKQIDRVDQIKANKELLQEYKSRLECADYSSFKSREMADFDIAKIEDRDAVSFYEPLARIMKAQKFKMTPEEYTRKLREYKSGKFEHGIFASKRWKALICFALLLLLIEAYIIDKPFLIDWYWFDY